MSDLIECRECPSPVCRGCNNYILATALREGKFDVFKENGTVRIEKIPAVDAVEVKHGRWERTSKSLMACSACGNCVVDDRISGLFFCPNCGARMDGRREDGDG